MATMRKSHVSSVPVSAIVEGNIDSAINIGDGYVVLKLKGTRSWPASVGVESPADLSNQYALLSADQIAEALEKIDWLVGTSLRNNQGFLDDMARQELLRRDELVALGELINGEELATRLGLSAQTIGEFCSTGGMFFLHDSSGRQCYPAFYASRSILFDDLVAITRVLNGAPASAKWQFFTTPKTSLLGRTPLEALRDGDLQLVITSVTGFMER